MWELMTRASTCRLVEHAAAFLGRNRTIIIGLALGFAAFGAGAQNTPAGSALSAWWDHAWSQAQQVPSFSEYRIDWRVDQYRAPSPYEMAEAKKLVELEPGSASETRLRQLEVLASGKPIVAEHSMWLRAPDSWRMNRRELGSDYNDVTVTPNVAWSCSPRYLSILNPKQGYPPGYDFRTQGSIAIRELGFMFRGGLQLGSILQLEPAPISVKGDDWSVDATNKDRGLRIRFSGKWLPEENRGEVHRIEVLESTQMPEETGHKWLLSGHRRVDELGEWVAGRVEDRAKGDRLTEVISFVGVSRYSDEEFKALTAVPVADGADPIRGKNRFVAIHDLREGEGIYMVETPGGPVVIPESETPWAKYETALRWTGWLAAAAIISTLVAIRLWRSQQHRRGGASG